MKKYKAEWALLVVAFIWGLTFPLIRSAIAHIDSYHFVFYRFMLAAGVFALFALKRRHFTKNEWLLGMLISFVLWISYITQTIGMETTSSGRAAFITGMNVVMVPFLAPWFGLKKPTFVDVLAAVGACVGLLLLTQPDEGGITKGDVWVLLCAFSYALYIILLQKILDRHRVDSVRFAFIQVFGVFVFSSLCIPFSKNALVIPNSSPIWIALLFCATFATIGTSWLQTEYQKYTTAQRTALIFSMEPVFAAMFGYFLIAEKMSLQSMVGASVILLSIVFCELWKAKKT